MSDLYQQGNSAFVDEDYGKACELYTQALQAEPSNAKILEARANAHLRMENWMDALQDSKMAAELDPKSSKALLRKGIASFHLEEYEAAKEAFDAGASLAPDNSQFQTWARKCQAELEDERAAAQPAPSLAPAPPTQQSAPSQAAPAATPPAAAPAPPPSASGASNQPLLNPKLPQVPERRFRHQWYQLQSKVTVDVYAKNMSKEQVSVTFGEQRLTVIIKEEGKDDYVLDIELFGKVKPEECHFEILKTKIEITMVKADGAHWADLEKSSKPSLPTPGAPAPGE
ncbi:HSP20-like chaperone [Dunaliella salina]|uniref:HSP20-like chaperone n=1 Tax=Dunaliella salina TaxID=3046 RepID=A0ABQ7G8Z3_DUNSA|nr:HSP20-like chaperone [Dunaliella salina]|eukprot:KAF5831066.1 HSP20-like chaperone [Dunaliella salina]